MNETIPCPAHGEQPAVPDGEGHGFTSCRRCWYFEWIRACLRYARRHP